MPFPAAERKNHWHEDGRGPDPVAGEVRQWAEETRRINKSLADQGQDHQHTSMCVPGPKERLLELCRGLATPHDAQHEPPAVFDGSAAGIG